MHLCERENDHRLYTLQEKWMKTKWKAKEGKKTQVNAKQKYNNKLKPLTTHLHETEDEH